MKKNYRNDGQGYDNILQNKFTAYVEQALIHNKLNYNRAAARHDRMELTDDMETELAASNEQDSSAEMAYEAANDDTLDMIENMSLFSALSSLDEKDAMILKLHVIYECSYVEIACIMGMTQTAVRTRYSRTIKKIRQSMEERK